ncbi:STAS domain-containing protein [Micromonospora sp. PSH03]|uniref:STAS domain-containing protein n=1 Tax=Micromonospora TaxID=1873 RepID=UPI001B377118|nr:MULTISPECIES: STAS domain-containing protein [Micromonospora]MBQ0991031.1 STAS domain-containing protein [Micromonospora sp. H61]MCG5457472.1 STAS domain-containing protein [Micromonospora salmantinae]
MSILEQPTRQHAQPTKPIMTLDLRNDRHAPLIAVSGEVDMSTAHLISELAEHVITRRPARLVLDLSEVTFFSAHGISALLRIQRAAESAEVTLALRAAASCVSYLLAVTSAGINLDIPAANASRLSHSRLGSVDRGE